MKNNLRIYFGFALLLVANSAGAANIYDNNMSALNINTLTDTFMSYTSYGEKMSDIFTHPSMYGTMDRIDEYGDDGSTTKSASFNSKNTNPVFDNVWANANHINGDLHYGRGVSNTAKFNLATLGATTRAVDLKYGNIAFGGFASFINEKYSNTNANGGGVGVFTKYKYRNLSATTLTDIGSINNNSHGDDYNNSWFNVATDAAATIKIDKTFFFKPTIYVAYTFVTSDDLYVDGNTVSSDDYNFFNVAPGLVFIKEIVPNWYGALSAKYIAHFGGENDIKIGNAKTDGLYLDNHSDIGIDVEHNFKKFIFGAKIHKQIGGVDSWSTNLNVKYEF